MRFIFNPIIFTAISLEPPLETFVLFLPSRPRFRRKQTCENRLHAPTDPGTGERVSLQQIPHTPPAHWNRTGVVLDWASSENLVPKPEDEVEEGTQPAGRQASPQRQPLQALQHSVIQRNNNHNSSDIEFSSTAESGSLISSCTELVGLGCTISSWLSKVSPSFFVENVCEHVNHSFGDGDANGTSRENLFIERNIHNYCTFLTVNFTW